MVVCPLKKKTNIERTDYPQIDKYDVFAYLVLGMSLMVTTTSPPRL